MKTVFHSLNTRVDRLTQFEISSKQRLDKLYTARLSLGIAIALLLFVQVLRSDNFVLAMAAAAVVAFLFLVQKTQKEKDFLIRLQLLGEFYRRQLSRWLGNLDETHWKDLPKIPESVASCNPALARDLNLFGPQGLWCLINETFTDRGFEALFRPGLELSFSQKDLDRARQVLPNLAQSSGPLRRFCIEGQILSRRLKMKIDELAHLVREPFVTNLQSRLVTVQTVAWVSWLGPLLFGFSQLAASLWIVYSILTFFILMRLGSSFSRANSLFVPLEQLARVFRQLEKTSDHHKELFPSLQSSRPSIFLRKLGRVVSFLSTEAHPVVFILLNLVLPWTPWSTLWAERLRLELQEKLDPWLLALADGERWASLSFLYKYQTSVFPEWGDCLKVEHVRHPLVSRSKVVANDFSFDGFRLGLITGSNMSGKSTFLRTIALNHVLALMGAPIFAKSFHTRRIPVLTCISVSDSLADGLSFFYAEVRQLKQLLDAAQSQEVLFFIDEVFRGTNNRERFLGAQALLEALLKTRSLGLVSTHDLELSNIADRNTELRNFHFREELRAEEMHFTYLLRQGPSPTTNALEIMRREGLPVPN